MGSADNRRNWKPSLKPGAFVQVHLNAQPNMAFIGYVALASDHRISLVVHDTVGPVEKVSEPCLGWVVYLPVSSVAWIRHLPNRSTGCECAEAVAG